jgi:hypothetical protein|tara:strand:- start:738 stop:866 length:129 start_codon:yes stop_codon:yes gene_type:complete
MGRFYRKELVRRWKGFLENLGNGKYMKSRGFGSTKLSVKHKL